MMTMKIQGSLPVSRQWSKLVSNILGSKAKKLTFKKAMDKMRRAGVKTRERPAEHQVRHQRVKAKAMEKKKGNEERKWVPSVCIGALNIFINNPPRGKNVHIFTDRVVNRKGKARLPFCNPNVVRHAKF